MSRFIEKDDSGMYLFYCPGCKCSHGITDEWDIDMNTDTISPSVLVKEHWRLPEGWDYETAERNEDGTLKTQENGKVIGAVNTRCHSFVRNGKIQFLNDCTHELAGKTVPMEPI